MGQSVCVCVCGVGRQGHTVAKMHLSRVLLLVLVCVVWCGGVGVHGVIFKLQEKDVSVGPCCSFPVCGVGCVRVLVMSLCVCVWVPVFGCACLKSLFLSLHTYIGVCVSSMCVLNRGGGVWISCVCLIHTCVVPVCVSIGGCSAVLFPPVCCSSVRCGDILDVPSCPVESCGRPRRHWKLLFRRGRSDGRPCFLLMPLACPSFFFWLPWCCVCVCCDVCIFVCTL